MKLESVFIRLGEDELTKFISRPALDILAALEQDMLRPERIRRLILKKIDPEAILRDKSMRAILIEALRPDDVNRLAKALGLPGQESPYKKLHAVNIRKNSNREKALFDFFEIQVPESEQALEKADTEDVLPDRGLFPHQLQAEKDVRTNLEGSGSRTMLHMPTGAGKTRTAMRVVASYLFKSGIGFVMWLSYSEELCEQAMEEFQSMWKAAGDRPVKTVRFYGKNSPDMLSLSKKHCGIFMVAGLKKIHEAAKKDTVFLSTLADRVSLVVMDEAHQAVAPTYKSILQILAEKHLNGPRLLGLSATPGRTWNDVAKDEELSNFFSRKKVTINTPGSPIDFLTRNDYIAKPTQEQIHYSGTLTKTELQKIAHSLDIPETVLKKLAGEKIRNIKIIEAVKSLVANGHTRIILFAATVNHARDMSFVLESRGFHSNYITSKTLPAVRRRVIEDYKEPGNTKILCNYGILTMGFDAPKTSAVVIARPTKSLVLYSQMVGRCIRGPKAGGNRECTIMTVVDIGLQGFGSITDAFSNWEDVW